MKVAISTLKTYALGLVLILGLSGNLQAGVCGDGDCSGESCFTCPGDCPAPEPAGCPNGGSEYPLGSRCPAGESSCGSATPTYICMSPWGWVGNVKTCCCAEEVKAPPPPLAPAPPPPPVQLPPATPESCWPKIGCASDTSAPGPGWCPCLPPTPLGPEIPGPVIIPPAGCAGGCDDGCCDRFQGENCLNCTADCGSCPGAPPVAGVVPPVAAPGFPVPPGFAPPPPVGPCGNGNLCGDVHSVESPTMGVQGVVLEMLDTAGRHRKTTKTDGAGHYVFNPVSGKHIVYVIPDRQWIVQPAQAVANEGDKKDFNISHMPFKLTVNTPKSGTFVLASTDPITTPSAPTITAGTRKQYYSGTSQNDRTVNLEPLSGTTWYITCWTKQDRKFVKSPSFQIPGTPAAPRTEVNINCP